MDIQESIREEIAFIKELQALEAANDRRAAVIIYDYTLYSLQRILARMEGKTISLGVANGKIEIQAR